MIRDKARKRMLARANYAKRCEDPDFRAFCREKERASRQARKGRDPEALKQHDSEKHKLAVLRRRATDLEGHKLKERLKSKKNRDRRKALNPIGLRERDKRKTDRTRWRSGRNRERDAETLLLKINAALPRGLPVDVRDDIASGVLLSVLEAQTAVTDVKGAVKKFITAHYRMFNGYKTSSIDEVIPGTDGLRRVDLIASDDPHF